MPRRSAGKNPECLDHLRRRKCGHLVLPAFFTRKIIEAVAQHKSKKQKTFYFQSKRPEYFEQFLPLFPNNVIPLTTLETNGMLARGRLKTPATYGAVSTVQGTGLSEEGRHHRAGHGFDEDVFPQWIVDLKPEYVWLGLNSKPKAKLPEPSPKKLRKLVEVLVRAGIAIRGKELRGLDIGISE